MACSNWSVALWCYWVLWASSRTRMCTLILGTEDLVSGHMHKLNASLRLWYNGNFFWLLGVAAAFGCAASIVGGLVNFFQPKFILKALPPSELRFRHNLFGLLTFTLGMTAMYLGYYSKFFTRYVDNQFIPAMMLTTVLVYLLTIIGPVGSLLTKLKYRKLKKQNSS